MRSYGKLMEGVNASVKKESGDLISRSALLKRFKESCQGSCKKCGHSTFLASDEHCGLIDEAPTVEAKPVVHGEWIEFDIDYGGIPAIGYQCSECGQSNGFYSDFCPNCGADMRGEKHD